MIVDGLAAETTLELPLLVVLNGCEIDLRQPAADLEIFFEASGAGDAWFDLTSLKLTLLTDPGRTLVVYERDHNVRQIWMDQDFPEGYPVSYMGYSVGRWDGNVLVVETKYLGARANNWLDSAGHLRWSARAGRSGSPHG